MKRLLEIAELIAELEAERAELKRFEEMVAFEYARDNNIVDAESVLSMSQLG